MKAWRVKDKWIEGSTVVYAETRGKAHALATYTDCCMDSEWNDISVIRIPEMDRLYRAGKCEADWYDPEVRLTLVKECGWSCSYDSFDWCECQNCNANEYCDTYQDAIEKENTP